MGTFCQDRLDAVKAQIIAYDAAITAIVEGGAQSYTLDTGQSKQTVTKLDIHRIQVILQSLENKYYTLLARCNGSGRSYGTPYY